MLFPLDSSALHQFACGLFCCTHVLSGTAGPLIRIIGDRWVWQVKAAILVTLGGLIAKAGLALKPFVPQLQTSFLKCLHDEVLPFDFHPL